jgi:hypothetical protein
VLIGSRTQAAPVVVLDVPPEFHEIPLDSDLRARTEAQLDVVDAMALDDPGQREALSLYLESLAIRLRSGDVGGTAFCAVRINGHPSTATLTVAVQPTGTPDRGVAVLGAAEAMRREQRYRTVELRPVGGRYAVFAESERSAGRSDDPSAPDSATIRELSVYLPVPDHEIAAMMTLSTPCLDDWGTYHSLIRDLCRTLRVESTQPDLVD